MSCFFFMWVGNVCPFFMWVGNVCPVCLCGWVMCVLFYVGG